MGYPQTTSPVDSIILLNNAAKDPATPFQPMELVVVYQDAQTREWVRQMWAYVTQQIPTEPIRSSWWRMDCLEHPHLHEGAVQAAVQADMIIVAVQASENIGFALARWLDGWIGHRAVEEGALVAMIGAVAPGDSALHDTQDYLREVARRSHLSFMSQVIPILAASAADSQTSSAISYRDPSPIQGFSRREQS